MHSDLNSIKCIYVIYLDSFIRRHEKKSNAQHFFCCFHHIQRETCLDFRFRLMQIMKSTFGKNLQNFFGLRELASWLGTIHILRKHLYGVGTVCWIEVKVAILCFVPWNLLLIKTLNNFWYFKHQISTRICSKAYLKHYWRSCLLMINPLDLLKPNT